MSTTSKAAAEIADRIYDSTPTGDHSEGGTYIDPNYFYDALHQTAQEAIAWRPELSEDVKERAKQYALSQYPETEVKGIHTRWMDDEKYLRRNVCELIYIAASADAAKRIAELEEQQIEIAKWCANNSVWRNPNGKWFNRYNERIGADDTILDLFRKETGR